MSDHMVYATHVLHEHPAPGMFARVMRPAPQGTPWRDDPRDRTTSTKAARWKPQPLQQPEAVPNASLAHPRWTEERIATLPLVSGHLTRLGYDRTNKHGVFIAMSCNGGSAKCWKQIKVLASVLAHPTRRPQSCLACCRELRKKSFGGPNTPKGYQLARDYTAAQKAAR